MACGAQQHGVGGECGCDPKELPDVVDVGDVLAHEHGLRRACRRIRVDREGLERGAVGHGEHAAMQVDSRERLEHGIIG